jgi:hypothetical protein
MLHTSKTFRACVSAAILACLGAFAATGAQAQQDQQRIMTIQSRLTKDGKADDFRKFAETGWKKFAQAAVDEGVYQSAMVIRLTAPFAAGAPANYAVVTFPAKRPSLAGPDPVVGERIAKRAGFSNLKAYIDGMNASSSVTGAEWLTTEASAGAGKAGNYILSWRWKVPQDEPPAPGQCRAEGRGHACLGSRGGRRQGARSDSGQERLRKANPTRRGGVPMSDLEAWDAGPPVIWLVVGLVVAIFLAIGVIGCTYQPQRPEAMCTKSEMRCGEY